MRLVAVQTGLSPLSVLGGTITDREFLTRLADRGIEVHVLAEAGEPIVAHRNLIPHHYTLRPYSRVPYVGNIDVALALRRLLSELDPVDWIRFNSPYSVGVGTIASANGHRVWGSYLHCEDYRFWKWLDSWLPKYCDLVTCLSEDTRNDLVARCPSSNHDRNIVVPMGVDMARFEGTEHYREEVRAELGIGRDDLVTLFVGVSIPRKGIADLVEAWRRLSPHPRRKLLLISKPSAPLESKLIASLAEEDSRVVYVPTVQYEMIPRYFAASDIFLFPTHREGFGIVVAEAMASGLPVITTRARGVRGVVVENETALVANVGDVEQLAAHLETLLSDGDLRVRLGAAGKERIRQHFRWDAVMDKLVKALDEG